MKYTIEGAIVPKARPRVSGHGYLPSNYRQWRNDAECQLLTQSRPPHPLSNVSITILLIGKHNRRGDADNISGSILDALVATNILADDNLKSVPELILKLNYSKIDPIAIIHLATLPDGIKKR